MPRKSPAAKALQLFTELLSDLETAVMRLAEITDPENLAGMLGRAAAQIGEIAASAGEGIQAAFDRGLEKVSAFLFDAALSQPLPSFELYAAPQPADWAEWDAIVGGSEAAPLSEDCALIGVQAAELAAQTLA